MMRFAWQNYRRYAMGKNELRPLTKDGYEGSMFGELTQTLGAPSAAPLWSALPWAFQTFLDSEDPSVSARSYSLAFELGMVRMVRG